MSKGKANKPMGQPIAYKETPRTSVDIKKASNGYVVSSYGTNGEKCMVAKSKGEAKKAAAKMLKI